MTHIPYKEMSQLYGAVATTEVDWALGSAASAGALEKAGKVRFINVAGPMRSRAYPDVPSVDENPATKGYAVTAWTGLFAPKGTPKAVRERISADVREALATPAVTERYRSYDYEVFDVGPDGFAEAIRNDTSTWGDVIRAAHLKLD
jgi:tripartite-type tricarboxylate transporter receptor subunit TctC